MRVLGVYNIIYGIVYYHYGREAQKYWYFFRPFDGGFVARTLSGCGEWSTPGSPRRRFPFPDGGFRGLGGLGLLGVLGGLGVSLGFKGLGV